jgi:hypothetical protein
VRLGEPRPLGQQRAADALALVLGVDRDVDDRHGQVVQGGQDQPQRADDGAVGDRGPVGAVAGAAGRHELTGEGDVVTRRPGWLVRSVGAATGRPDLAPVGETFVVRAELDDLRG